MPDPFNLTPEEQVEWDEKIDKILEQIKESLDTDTEGE